MRPEHRLARVAEPSATSGSCFDVNGPYAPKPAVPLYRPVVVWQYSRTSISETARLKHSTNILV